MTEFIPTVLSRDEFLDWLGGGLTEPKARPSETVARDHRNREVTLLYEQEDKGANFEPIIAVSIDDMDEFFAFTSTYVASYRPFSAFYRVIPLELVDGLANQHPLHNSEVAPFAKLIAGGVLAEHLLHRRSSKEAFSSALTAAKATLSATLGSAVIAGCDPLLLAWVSEQWSELHRGEVAAYEPDSATDILVIWQFLSAAIHPDAGPPFYNVSASTEAVMNFLQAAARSGVTSDILRELRLGIRSDVNPEQVLSLSREDRIRSFNHFVSGMGERGSDGLEEPFLAGLLLAIVGNGSFDMLRSARELAGKSPAAIIWFGICAALFREGDLLTTANSLGRRIVRDLRAADGLFSLPNADVGLFEYRALMRETEALDQIIAASADALCVEILPDVMTYVARGSIDRDGRSIEDYHLMAESLREIRLVVDRVARRIDRTGNPRQRELYGDDNKPRRKR